MDGGDGGVFWWGGGQEWGHAGFGDGCEVEVEEGGVCETDVSEGIAKGCQDHSLV